MASFVPSSAETLEDQRLYTRARLTEVGCLDCLARVLVKKNSEHHTSIQWNDDALRQCPEFGRLEREPGGRPVHVGCSRLVDSIEQATHEGRLPVGAEDGY